MQPSPGEPRGPWWLHEAAADLTSLGGISVLTLFALIALGFLLSSKKRLSAVLLVVGLAGGVVLSEGLKAMFERAAPPGRLSGGGDAERQLPLRPRPAVDGLLSDASR